MIEISGFPDKFWMFAKNPHHWSEPLVFYTFFPAGRAVTGKEYCTHTLGYPCKNLSVVTMKDLWKKKERGGFLFTSYSPHHLPMNRENVSVETLIWLLTFLGVFAVPAGKGKLEKTSVRTSSFTSPPPLWHSRNILSNIPYERPALPKLSFG